MFAITAFLRPTFGELLLIALIVALLFGTRRLPELGRSLGTAIKNFQRSFKGEGTDAPSPEEKTEEK